MTATSYEHAELLITEGSLAGCLSSPKLRLLELFKSGSTKFVHLKDGTICHLTIPNYHRPSRRQIKDYAKNSLPPSQSNRPTDLVTDPTRDS